MIKMIRRSPALLFFILLLAAQAAAQQPAREVVISAGAGTGPETVLVGSIGAMTQLAAPVGLGATVWLWRFGGFGCETIFPTTCGESGAVLAGTARISHRASALEPFATVHAGAARRAGLTSPVAGMAAGVRMGSRIGVTAKGEWLRIFDEDFREVNGETLAFASASLGLSIRF